MNSQSTFDRETFQRLLASAFAVQESQIDRESLSAILDVQRSLASGKLDLGGAMHSVVESARTVANASGVAIGLLRGHELTYQAGSGTSAAWVGQHVTASLTASATTKSGREILRVENAQADNRIEADICRQFGASALLILPIYHERAVAGVMDIRFGEPHSFQDREVRTYQLMAEQIEAAIFQSAQLEQKNQLAANLPIPMDVPLPTEALVDDLPDAPEFWMGESSVPSLFERCAERYESALAAVRELPAFKQSATFAITMLRRAKKLATKRATDLTGPNRLRYAALGSAAVALAIAWIVYTGHRPASSVESSTLPKSNAFDPSENLVKHPGRVGDVPELTGKDVRRARIVRKRVRMGDSDVEYFGDDVTVRWFTARTAKHRTMVAKSRVTHFGDDVTVRYFSQPQPAVVPVSQ